MHDLMPILEARPLPEESLWHGMFIGDWGSARRLIFTFEAALRIAAPVIAGVGRGHDFPYQAVEPNSFEIVGRTIYNNVEIDLWFCASFLRNTPFVCDGMINNKQDKITGNWSLACFSDCGCGGGGGEFSIRRARHW